MFRISVAGAKTLAEVHPHAGASGQDVWFRADWVPHDGIVVRLESSGRTSDATPAWFVEGRRTTVSLIQDRSDPCSVRIMPSRLEGDRIDIRCHIGATVVTKRVWCITGEIRVRDRGPISFQSRNGARRRVIWALFQGRPAQGLGLFTLPDASNGNTNYGALVEVVGVVRPWDVPVPFHLIRRVIYSNITLGAEALNQIEAGDDDTSHRHIQDQSLSPQGFVYDVDAPGSSFSPTDPVGMTHSWNIRFEQLLVIGRLPPRFDWQPGNAWQQAEMRGLAVSPIQRWAADYSVTVTRAGRHPEVQRQPRHIGEIA